MRISWKSLVSIFATVAISPWNLLVGGLLIQHLTFLDTILAILGGYCILGIIFICYGGLGFAYRQQSAKILGRIFPSSIVRYGIPLVLAAGQIGWAGINFELGGRSLGALLALPSFVGILIYGVLLTCWALLTIRLLGISKWVVVAASIGLMAWIGGEKLHATSLVTFFSHQPVVAHSLFWGLSVVVASFISFATVSPDFFKDVKKKNDIVLATLFGIMLPGACTAFLGAFLFFDRSNFDLVALISSTSFFFFPHLFNAVTNTDGTIATYVAGLKMQGVFTTSYKKGVVLAGLTSIALALLGITSHLESWLTVLSILFPLFIGICFPAFIYQQYKKKATYKPNLFIAFSSSLILSCFALVFFPPVLIALLAPLVMFSVSLGYTSISLWIL